MLKMIWLKPILVMAMGILFAVPHQLSAADASETVRSPEASAQTAPSLPSEERWLQHVRHDLGRFWMQETAYGTPHGNFPTFRCNDGSLPDPVKLCQELSHDFFKNALGRDYTRMKSRQTFAYGVIYHLTGDTQALKMASAGVDYLIRDRLDREHGGFISYRENGEPGLKPTQRPSQDQAYGLLGLAFYYYLTRDPAVEQVLLSVQRHIFEQYLDEQTQQLKWVIEDSDEQLAGQQELVAQLDQINAYMLLVTPLLPEPAKTQWRRDLQWLTERMLALYHDPREMRFYGGIHHPSAKSPGARHNDYGHTIKAYWMTYLVGRYLDNQAWIALAEKGMASVLARASVTWQVMDVPDDRIRDELVTLLGEDGEFLSWRDRENSHFASWWQWAELDQAALTLGLIQPQALAYANQTVQGFVTRWVDPEYGEIDGVKQHQWKNGYHSLEHALVGYLLSQAHRGDAATLYFALPPGTDPNVAPYYCRASQVRTSRLGKLEEMGLEKVSAVFNGIH